MYPYPNPPYPSAPPSNKNGGEEFPPSLPYPINPSVPPANSFHPPYPDTQPLSYPSYEINPHPTLSNCPPMAPPPSYASSTSDTSYFHNQPYPPTEQYRSQAYPPTSQAYPPTSQAYPPTSQAYPPTSQAYPPASQAYPPASQAYPPASQAYPPPPPFSSSNVPVGMASSSVAAPHATYPPDAQENEKGLGKKLLVGAAAGFVGYQAYQWTQGKKKKKKKKKNKFHLFKGSDHHKGSSSDSSGSSSDSSSGSDSSRSSTRS
ncbi:hypothetical protein HMI54_014134 [Coelomomyces lativittatus]|nr:hypothetical protein HMI54_014134 [Coelomomyces lativittatus]